MSSLRLKSRLNLETRHGNLFYYICWYLDWL